MHRFYLPPEHCRTETLRLTGREAHHGLHVLRLKPGETVTVLDGAGQQFTCAVESATRDLLILAVKAKVFTPPPPCPVTLLVAIPKGKIIEDIIQKAVELGTHRIVPLLSERVITHLDADGAESKREKWQQVAVEAIKQCGAVWLPRVEAPVAIPQYLARREKFDLPLVGSLQTERRHPREWLREFLARENRPPQSAAIWIGPEGDFTAAELHAIEAAGARPITLGPLTLRVETAAIYCLSFLNYELAAPHPATAG